MVNRRVFNKCLFNTTIPGAASAWGFEPVSMSLREIAAGKNLLMGSAVSFAQLQRPNFTSLLTRQAGIVVSENDMKWERIHPEPNRFDYRRADSLLKFAKEHRQQLRGHNLCWHQQLPTWFKQAATPQNASDLLQRHITEVAGHFAGQIHSWDVVNEAVQVEDGLPDGFRNSPWLQLIGPQYIEIAFRTASKADEHALLAYNDYDLEQAGAKHEAKRYAVLRLLTTLRGRNVPIDAVGLQSHLQATGRAPDWAGLHRFLEQIERLGLQVFVTELDVNDSGLPGDVTERDRTVSELYRDYLENVLQHSSVTAILTWGLTDKDTWLNSFAPRKDKLPQRSLPFDEEFKPMPAFYAMCDTISAAAARPHSKRQLHN
jgi:endo-1,4-beta-xylanase